MALPASLKRPLPCQKSEAVGEAYSPTTPALSFADKWRDRAHRLRTDRANRKDDDPASLELKHPDRANCYGRIGKDDEVGPVVPPMKHVVAPGSNSVE